MDPFKPQRNLRGSLSASEWRRHGAEAMFQTTLGFLEEAGWMEEGLVYDRKREVFVFSDGTFAFSREYANWAELKRRDLLDG